MEVTPELSSESFFYDVVTTALGRLQVDTTKHTEFYLVELLSSYARDQRTLPSEPLGLMLMKTREAAMRILVLKEVGDTSLLVTGFFPESIERTLVSAEYYQGLGKAAYMELSSRLSKSVLSGIYDELAVRFREFVAVLGAARSLVQLSGVVH
jgi:hypothetical protein